MKRFHNCRKGVIHNSVSPSIEVLLVSLLGYEVNTIITCLILIKAATNDLVSWSYRQVISNGCFEVHDFITKNIREGRDFGQNSCMPSSEEQRNKSVNIFSGVVLMTNLLLNGQHHKKLRFERFLLLAV